MSVVVKKRNDSDVKRARKYAARVNKTIKYVASMRSYDADWHCVIVYKAEEPVTLRTDWENR